MGSLTRTASSTPIPLASFPPLVRLCAFPPPRAAPGAHLTRRRRHAGNKPRRTVVIPCTLEPVWDPASIPSLPVRVRSRVELAEFHLVVVLFDQDYGAFGATAATIAATIATAVAAAATAAVAAVSLAHAGRSDDPLGRALVPLRASSASLEPQPFSVPVILNGVQYGVLEGCLQVVDGKGSDELLQAEERM